MKIAHLILTHSMPGHLQRLVNKLQHEDSDFYIHVDAKTDIAPFLPVADKENVQFIKHRVKVYWGGYSIVEATLKGFEQIIASGKRYDHINLLSGQDYPIKSTEHIHKYLGINPGKIFMHYLSIMDEWHEAIPRITKYYLTHYRFRGSYRVEELMNKVLPKRKMPQGIIPVGRSQWFTATHESVAYIVRYYKENPWVARFFKLTWAPDEIVFQTILYNAPFQKDMVNDNLVYVDWSKGEPSPKVLGMEDAEKLKMTDALFARKFNPDKDSNILDYIDGITS